MVTNFCFLYNRDRHPAARTLLMRGYDERGFQIYTDYTSPKSQELVTKLNATTVATLLISVNPKFIGRWKFGRFSFRMVFYTTQWNKAKGYPAGNTIICLADFHFTVTSIINHNIWNFPLGPSRRSSRKVKSKGKWKIFWAGVNWFQDSSSCPKSIRTNYAEAKGRDAEPCPTFI